MRRDRASARILRALVLLQSWGVCLVSGSDLRSKAGVGLGSEKSVLTIVCNSASPLRPSNVPSLVF